MGLRIGFEGTSLLGQRSGIGKHTYRLLGALLDMKPDWEFLLYSNRPLEPLGPCLSRAKPVISGSPSKRLLWMHFVLPSVIRNSQPNLCHFPNSMAPLRQQSPFVLTIHDASLFIHSNHHPLARLISIRLPLTYLARKASAVITVTNNSKDKLLPILNIPAEKVHVIHNAPASDFEPISDPAQRDAIRDKYELPDQYLLFVGTLESRKNLVRLVRAFDQVQKKGFPHQLIIAGADGWMSDRLYEEIENLDLQSQVRLIGYVPDNDLPGLLSMSTLLVYPSLFEGFGLPPVEAMTCGTAVVTSDCSSMPEVCGDAAHYVDPEDETSIAEGIITVLEDEEYRQELIRRGFLRASLYSWEEAARKTIDLYELVLGSSAGF